MIRQLKKKRIDIPEVKKKFLILPTLYSVFKIGFQTT